MGNVFYGVQSCLNSVVYTIGQYYDHPTDFKDTALCSKNPVLDFCRDHKSTTVMLVFKFTVVYPISKEYTYMYNFEIMV